MFWLEYGRTWLGISRRFLNPPLREQVRRQRRSRFHRCRRRSTTKFCCLEYQRDITMKQVAEDFFRENCVYVTISR